MSSYTTEEDRNLVAYMAIGKHDRRNRLGSKLYRQMVLDEDWAKRHTWSAWRDHYKLNQETLDRRIETYQDKRNIQPRYPSRRRFTSRDDEQLIDFLAEYAPMEIDGKGDTKFSRKGEFIYREILTNFQKYPWASSHPWRSWRERYINHTGDFDERIAKWQEKKGIDPSVQINLVREMYKNHRARMVLGMEKAGNDKYSGHESHSTDERRENNATKRPRSDGDEQERSARSTEIDVRQSKRQNRMHLESFDSFDTLGAPPRNTPSRIPVHIDDNAEGLRLEPSDGGPRVIVAARDNVEQLLDKDSGPSHSSPFVEGGTSGDVIRSPPTPLSDVLPEFPVQDGLQQTPTAAVHSRASTSPVAHVHSGPPFSFQSLEPGLQMQAEADLAQGDLPGEMPSPGDAYPPTPVKRVNSLATSSRATTQSLSPSSFSDGPFGTCPSSPRRIQVVHELPKFRKRSFRTSDRTRVRKVIPSYEITSNASRGSETDENEELDSSSHSLVGIKQRHSNEKLQYSSQNKIPHMSVPSYGRATSTPAAPAVSSKASQSNFSDESTVQNISDVFTSATPGPSGITHKPYALNTSHLPLGSSVRSGSSPHSVSTSTLPNGKLRKSKRRHSFPHFVLRAGLPYIDLLAELKTKRKTSRSPSMVSAMRSPDVTVSGREKSRDLVFEIEPDVMRRGPSRKSITPLVTHSKTSAPRGELSPSTSDFFNPERSLDATFKLMEENHGFSYGVVRRTWVRENYDLNATDRKLLQMRIAAERVVDEEVETLPSPASDIFKAKVPDRNREEYKSTSVPNTATASPTDYTPPYRSRAGHYRRFIEQGRYWEARQREIDLTSRVSAHGSISPPKHSPRTKPPTWGEKENEALLTSSEGCLRSLAEKFGENFIRRKTLSLMMHGD